MTKRLHRNGDVLRKLCQVRRSSALRHLLARCPLDTALCLSDLARNILSGILPLNAKQRQVLSRHRHVLREIQYLSPTKIRHRLSECATPRLISALTEPGLTLIEE